MTRIEWDESTRLYEYGVDRTVLYFRPGIAVPWDGIISIEENTEPVALEPIFFDGDVVNIQRKPQVFKARVTAYTYPAMLEDYIITQFNDDPYYSEAQRNQPVHLTYRSKTQDGYQVHLVYNCAFIPQPVSSSTIGTEAEIEPFVFELVALPPTSGVNIYPHNGNRYDSPDPTLLPPPPGSSPEAYATYYKNRYIEDQIPGLPPFIYEPEYPDFNLNPGLDFVFPTPHFAIDWNNFNIGSLENFLYGDFNLNPQFPSLGDMFNLMVGGPWWEWVGEDEFGLSYNMTIIPSDPAWLDVQNIRAIGIGDGHAIVCWSDTRFTAGPDTYGSYAALVKVDNTNGSVVVVQQITIHELTDLLAGHIQKTHLVAPRTVLVPFEAGKANGDDGVILQADISAGTLNVIHTINAGNGKIGGVATNRNGSAAVVHVPTIGSYSITWITIDGSSVSEVNETSPNAYSFWLDSDADMTTYDGVYTVCVTGAGLKCWTFDYSARTLALSATIPLTAFSNTWRESAIIPGDSSGTVHMAKEDLSRRIDILKNIPTNGGAVPAPILEGSYTVAAASQDSQYQFTGLVRGLRGIAHIILGTSGYSRIIYYNDVDDVYLADNNWEWTEAPYDSSIASGMAIADCGQGIFILAWSSGQNDLRLMAGWAR